MEKVKLQSQPAVQASYYGLQLFTPLAMFDLILVLMVGFWEVQEFLSPNTSLLLP